MKTLSIAAALLLAFGTVSFAQDASSTTKTSTTKTTPIIHATKHNPNRDLPPAKFKHPPCTKTPAAK